MQGWKLKRRRADDACPAQEVVPIAIKRHGGERFRVPLDSVIAHGVEVRKSNALAKMRPANADIIEVTSWPVNVDREHAMVVNVQAHGNLISAPGNNGRLEIAGDKQAGRLRSVRKRQTLADSETRRSTASIHPGNLTRRDP